jgi:hypothetical protein
MKTVLGHGGNPRDAAIAPNYLCEKSRRRASR